MKLREKRLSKYLNIKKIKVIIIIIIIMIIIFNNNNNINNNKL